MTRMKPETNSKRKDNDKRAVGNIMVRVNHLGMVSSLLIIKLVTIIFHKPIMKSEEIMEIFEFKNRQENRSKSLSRINGMI